MWPFKKKNVYISEKTTQLYDKIVKQLGEYVQHEDCILGGQHFHVSEIATETGGKVLILGEVTEWTATPNE